MPPTQPLLLQTPLPYHNLPQPTYLRLVGREQELAWLRERLLPSEPGLANCNHGDQRRREAALALAVAPGMSTNTRKYRRGPALRRHHLGLGQGRGAHRARACTGQSARADSPHARGHLPHHRTGAGGRGHYAGHRKAQDFVVQKALRRQRTLLIIDNLESVKDERVKTRVSGSHVVDNNGSRGRYQLSAQMLEVPPVRVS